jgi:UDP-glucose 4-epimerase
MVILVTGGAGFIGSHLADALLERGDEVTILDDLSSGRRENIDGALESGADLVEGDIRDTDLVARTVSAVRPEAVVHLAAQSRVRHSVDQPAFDAAVNVVGTINLLEAVRNLGRGRFVLASTGGAVYGEGGLIDLPAVESAPLRPLCPYGQSKVAAEQYLDLYRRVYGLSSIGMRLANVYGPRQDPRGEAGAVATFGELLLRGGRPVVFGDGNQTRDFVYVDDVIEALLKALAGDVQGPVNIGTGTETSLLSLLDSIATAAEDPGPVDPEFEPARPGEVKRIAVDASRARSELGWSATTSLEDGLRRTLDSLR